MTKYDDDLVKSALEQAQRVESRSGQTALVLRQCAARLQEQALKIDVELPPPDKPGGGPPETVQPASTPEQPARD